MSISCSAREEGEWGENLLLLALSNDALGRSGEVNRSNLVPRVLSRGRKRVLGTRLHYSSNFFSDANCVEGIKVISHAYLLIYFSLFIDLFTSLLIYI